MIKVDATTAVLSKKILQSIRAVISFTPEELSSKGNPDKLNPFISDKNAIWTRMDKLIETLYGCCVQIWNLQVHLN